MKNEPRTILPNARLTPRFAGMCTFGRYPLLEDVVESCRPVDWAIFGAPFDTGVTYRPGTRFGPRAVRIESQYLKPYHIEHDLMLTEVLSLADAGDSPVNPFSCETNARVIADFAKGLGDASTKLLMLGGDHSNTLATLRAAHARAGAPRGGLAMIHFDSHVDTVDMTLGEKYSHASPFIRAVEEGVLDPQRMLSIGVKGPLNTPDDLRYAREKGVTLVTYEQWRREGTKTIDAFLKKLGDDPTYLTFDIDCIDPAFAPGTGTPCLGGFTSAEALALLRHVATVAGPPNLVGADVVEVLPDRDVSGITALLAAHVAFEILCIDGLRRRGAR
ncbi:MAG: agmatinase [Phycisphaerales bacterium]